MSHLSASIVMYRPDQDELRHVLQLLLQSANVVKVYLVDNSPEPLPSLPSDDARVCYIFSGSNLGYGTAHNIAIRKAMELPADYHLVLNSDIDFQPAILSAMLAYMEAHQDVALLQPKVLYPNGEVQYLAKRLPTPLDVFGRRFLPKSWIKKRNERFELRASGYSHVMNVPYLSGCFMFLRVSAMREIGLFDERFFMYPEDIDLTRRLHAQYKTLFFPEVSVIHRHRQASYKSARLLWVHIRNLCKYFCKWGWVFDAERTRMNRQVEQEVL